MPEPRQYHSQQVHFLRKRFRYSDGATATVTVGKIPAGSSVIGGGIHTITAFNAGTNNLVNVGFIGSTTDADGYATVLSVAAVGYLVLDELGATTNIQQTVDTTVTVTLALSGTAATAGVADAIIMYVPNIDG